ncbi:metallophosphoesterase [Pacificimonas sp. WHA3]|uniref:Metallophosphoesterase n=1 Tax=Pacificimonas pallii TaxID=2827236 RepID=A0ABS6SFI3_9SPHN|nr:metallophosphoesterase family protein [Pacificimonas pallii]MBV7257140.1 metallophosphoesterase [Pacificimonas pallii]
MKRTLAALLAAALTYPAAAEPVRFAVFGDIQEETAEGHAKDLALADRINAAQPDFTVFVGDIQGGGPCTDRQREEAAEVFARISGPLVFVPGDNAWTDCRLPGKGDFDPLERLAKLRDDLVPEGRSLGQAPMSLIQQEGEYRENARWNRGEVVFVTLHMPGGNNGVYPDRYAFEEYERRNAANLVWLAAAYDEVRRSGAKGLVVMFHGNPGWEDIYWRASAYRDFKDMLANEGEALGVPILAIHGDTHRFTVDKPLAFKDGKTRADHLIRLEVFGSPERGFVLVTADSGNPELYSFTPVEVEGHPAR